MEYPKLSAEELISRLAWREQKIRMVLDTDTFNEVDDQFAVIYTLLSGEKLGLEALYAAPFSNKKCSGVKNGMEKSYQEIEKILGLCKAQDRIPAYRGSESYLPDGETPVESEAARNLVERAMSASAEEPLYVAAIGAVTNVASAILMEPRIIERIVVVWLGGHALHWNSASEFNLYQDLHATRILLDSGVPLVLVPCMGVASHLQTSQSELRDYVLPCGELGSYLYETYSESSEDHFAYTRVIWDISVIAYLINEQWASSSLVHSPRLSDDFRWSTDTSRHFIRYVHRVNRNLIFRDLFTKLKEYSRQ
ncbi:MAG: nucleoside hydrolase [Paenibacillaceae bacterium]|jgi:inosine-uridine nucleoside N-ribohydrolase|nr:nucleoside hydrolase [Paenibacillaceae bacterium]